MPTGGGCCGLWKVKELCNPLYYLTSLNNNHRRAPSDNKDKKDVSHEIFTVIV